MTQFLSDNLKAEYSDVLDMQKTSVTMILHFFLKSRNYRKRRCGMIVHETSYLKSVNLKTSTGSTKVFNSGLMSTTEDKQLKTSTT